MSSINTTQFSVDGTAVKIAASNGSPLEIHIHSKGQVYISGTSAVTTSTGLQLDNGDKTVLTIPDNSELWCIANGGTYTVQVMAITL